jgi:hypothetical protein
MCPVCIAAAALVAIKFAGTGGLTLLAVKRLNKKQAAIPIPTKSEQKEDYHG